MKNRNALKQSEEWFRTLFETVPFGIGVATLDGRLLIYNDAMLVPGGYTHEDMTKINNVADLYFNPDDRAKVLAIAQKQGYVCQHEVRFRRRDGGYYEASLSLTRTIFENQPGWQAVVEDITARKQAEKALCEREEMYRCLIEGVPDIVYTYSDKRGGLFYSLGVESVLGYTASYLLDHPRLWHDSIHPDDLPAVDRVIQELAEGEGFDIEYRIRDAKGMWHWLRDRCFMRLHQNGDNLIQGIATDITDHKHTEQRLAQYRDQLKGLASELTLTEERLKRNIATRLHDMVGQSLAMTKMNVETLRASVTDMHVKEELAQISRLLEHALQESQSLTAQISYPALNILGLERAIEKWLNEEIGVKHGLHTDFKNDGQTTDLSEDIKAVLFRSVCELLVNAVKHARADHVNVAIRHDNGVISISVLDNGIGFDPNKTTNGFGMLSIRESLERLGGELQLGSKSGSGTRVTITAPVLSKT